MRHLSGASAGVVQSRAPEMSGKACRHAIQQAKCQQETPRMHENLWKLSEIARGESGVATFLSLADRSQTFMCRYSAAGCRRPTRQTTSAHIYVADRSLGRKFVVWPRPGF